MNYNSPQQNLTTQPKQIYLENSGKFYYSAALPTLSSDTWVKLLELPSYYSYDEALLLCQLSSDEWLAWIPDHGEAVLQIRQFDPVATD